MKKILFIALSLFMTLAVQAQDATKILDKTAATLRTAGDAKISFTLETGGTSATGYIKLQHQKFVLNLGGTITWFDGQAMWTYVKANDEVNVTTPSADAVAKMNPYSFLSFYKKGYTAKLGQGATAKEYNIILTGKDGAPYKKVEMRINKGTYHPTIITMTTSKDVSTTIRCNSILKNQKYQESTFRFNPKNYPSAEVIDLR